MYCRRMIDGFGLNSEGQVELVDIRFAGERKKKLQSNVTRMKAALFPVRYLFIANIMDIYIA